MRSILLLVLLPACVRPEPAIPMEPIDPSASAGIAYLQQEIPLWKTENNCYSCHNNGDAARALYQWTRLGGEATDPIPDTSAWLRRPELWEHNGGEEEFSDQHLALVQFAAALVSADEAGLGDRTAMERAGQQLAADQHATGAWLESSRLGSPITYGAFLATHMARASLLRIDSSRYREQIAAADRWFRETAVETVIDAAATIWALEGSSDAGAVARREHCMDLVQRGESPDGGWGPYTHSAPEVFDTALVVLALMQFADDPESEPEVAAMIDRGRSYLIRTQESDGGWPETTRPSGNLSYAHRISTTGWATQALLVSTNNGANRPD